MYFRNETPFPAQSFYGSMPDLHHSIGFYVVVFHQTLTATDEGLAYADDQSLLWKGGVIADASRQIELPVENRLYPFKPTCDIILNAVTYAPKGNPDQPFPARLQVLSKSGEPLLDKTLHVTGPKTFRRPKFLARLFRNVRKAVTVTINRLWSKDIGFVYWKNAAPDQRVPNLKGDETIILTNLCHPKTPGAFSDLEGNTLLRLALPGHQPRLTVWYDEHTLSSSEMELETVNLDPEENTLVLVWRCVLPNEPPIGVLEAHLIHQKDKARVVEPRFRSSPHA